MNSVSTGHKFRDSTLEQRASAQFQSPHRGRQVLTPSKTASYVRSPDRRSVEPENTRLKLDARVALTFQRFWIAHATQLKTSRGHTALTGSRATGGWEAAHASLTPRLRIEKYGNLNKENEYLRNSTYEQPRGANRFDCHLETVLRPLEDDLANQCTKHELTPQEATVQLLKKYLELSQIFVQNIKIRQGQFERFVSLHKGITDFIKTPETTEKETYEKFFHAVHEYLTLKRELTGPLRGSPSFRNFILFGQKKPMYHLLWQIDESIDSFHKIKDRLAMSPFSEEDVVYHREDLTNRLEEGEAQMAKIEAIYTQPESFDTLYFGICESGKRREPTEEEIAEQLERLFI